jgi:replication factor A1
VKDRSGLIYRCPECGRVLSSTICPEHGRVTPKTDLRIKAVLDDGTGGMVCIFDRAQTERILGFGIDEALKKIQENFGNAGVIKDIIEEKIIAVPLRVRGNVISKEKYGLTMLVKDFEILDVKEIAKKAEKMLEDMGW